MSTATTTPHTTASLAEQWDVSVQKVRDLAAEVGVGLNFGGKAGYRFSDDDVQKMLAALRPAPVVQQRRRRRRT